MSPTPVARRLTAALDYPARDASPPPMAPVTPPDPPSPLLPAAFLAVAVTQLPLPFIGVISAPNAGITNAGPILTVIGLVAIMNVVNFSDGLDGLAAGVCVIIAATMTVIAFDLGRAQPGVLAALTA